MPIRGDDFKDALRRWASGVTIVTSRAGDLAMIGNIATLLGLLGTIVGLIKSFAGVSLDPPLVLVCADKGSDTLQVISDGGVFAVNVLARDQQELSDRFAWGDEATRFDAVAWRPGATGSPLIYFAGRYRSLAPASGSGEAR